MDFAEENKKKSNSSRQNYKKVWRLFANEEFNAIRTNNYLSEELEKIFQDEGEHIFSNSILSRKTSHLKFLMEYCEKTVIQRALTLNNLETLVLIINTFDSKPIFENISVDTRRQISREKAKLILSFGDEKINKYIDNNLTERVKNELKITIPKKNL